MKEFTITASRLMKEQAVFTIEAESEGEARDLAIVALHPSNEGEYHLYWEPVQPESAYVVSIEEK